MTLKNDVEWNNTREKLRELEEHYEFRQKEPVTNQYVRELTLRSLKKFINQLKEEIAIYESHRLAKR